MQEETVTIDAVTGTENASSLELSHDGGNNVETIETAVDMKEAVSNVHEVSGMSSSPEDLDGEIKVEVSSYPLECCMRIVPHDQNSGAFFIAVLKKISPLQGKTKSF